MNKVGVVSAFVPLDVKHLTAEQYHEYGRRLTRAVNDAGIMMCKMYNTLEECWLYKESPPMVPANPVPGDRYAGPVENVFSNIVQHNRTEWAMSAMNRHPDIDVWVWLDYAVLKQGGWRNNQVTEESITRFLEKVKTYEFYDIPFPGISSKSPVLPIGNNWRFCGSTHIWPKKFLTEIDLTYKTILREWIRVCRTTPLDLPIWALVEQTSCLPFRFYEAEYDASQVDNFPGV